MKRFTAQLVRISLVTLFCLGLSATMAHAAAAGSAATTIFGWGLDMTGFVTSFVANIATLVLTVTSWMLSLAGMLLNVGMYLTTHVGLFINNTPVIYSIWQTIRDLSSIALIFMLLFAAIRMILDLDGANYKSLLVSIVFVGVLINFSFFFTRTLIDVSNIVSLEFYNAIAPTNSALIQDTNLSTLIPKMASSGGISDIFMGALKVNQWYNNHSQLTNTIGGNPDGAKISAPLQTIIITVAGSIVMILAALSFLVAALVCVIRLATLIFLLAFSAVWIASKAIPQLGEFSDKWWKQFWAQLVFLPTYLALMYVVIRILNESNLNNLVGADPVWNSGLSVFINLFVGFAIIILLINMPLVIAIQISGGEMKWTEKLYGNMRGWVGKHSIGRFSYGLDKRLANTYVGNSSIGRTLRSATIGSYGKSKFGGTTIGSFEDTNKEGKEIKKKATEMGRRKDFGHLLSDAAAGRPFIGDNTLKANLGKMSEKERLSLGKDKLKDPNVLRYLKKSDFDAIKKSEDLSEDDKREIMEARKDTFAKAVTGTGNNDTVKDMMKSYGGDDLAGMKEEILKNPKLIGNLTPGHLKTMADSDMGSDVRRKIGDTVNEWAAGHEGKNHPAFGFIQKNRSDWLSEAAPASATPAAASGDPLENASWL